MDVHELSSTDRDRVAEVETQILDAAQQLGFCREQYLQREQAIRTQLEELRRERTGMLRRLSKDYVGEDADINEWRYNADTKAFERLP